MYIHGQRVVKGAKDILEVLERHPVVCIISGEESLSKYAGVCDILFCSYVLCFLTFIFTHSSSYL